MQKMVAIQKTLLGCVLAVWASIGFAQEIKVNHVWARATVTGQKATGAFMDMHSQRHAKLIRVESQVGKTELHEMVMQNGVMKMRPVTHIFLPANTPVVLQPGGLHVMIVGLKKQLKAGEKLPLTLTFEFEDKSKETVVVEADIVKHTEANVRLAH